MTRSAFQGPAHAATPKDTLLIAKQIDNVMTIDPAEMFEFSSGEVANVYDCICTFEAEDTETLVPGSAAEAASELVLSPKTAIALTMGLKSVA